MVTTIELRDHKLTASDQESLWESLVHDISLQDIPYKIETDAWGSVVMSPAQSRHSRMARRVARMLEDRLGGEALAECAIVTAKGVKVPDVVWCSDYFLANHWSETALRRAPEICVEVVSPSNARVEMMRKVMLFLTAGAAEVWLVSEAGAVVVHEATGVRKESSFGFDPTAALASR